MQNIARTARAIGQDEAGFADRFPMPAIRARRRC
jgi:hypothetical protein